MKITKRLDKAFMAMLLVMSLMLAPFAAFPDRAYADTDEDESHAASISDIWVVPEVISGARQPASGGMFAWVTFDFDYYYEGVLADDLDAGEFVLQQKTEEGWETIPGNNIVVLGGEDYYIASFEAIVAARVPDNTDPYIKKWRIVYKPDSETERIESELIVQAAALEETDDVVAFNDDYCIDFKVEQAPWNYEEYQTDHIPPVYIAYVYPDVTTRFSDTGLVTSDDAAHSIRVGGGAGISFHMDENGRSFETEYFNMVETDLCMGDPDEGGIAGLVAGWNDMKDWGMWSGAEDLPDAEALYEKLSSVVCVPDENADEYLSYVVDGTNVFWVSGAGTQERIDLGVTDYILVVVRDWESYGTTKHDWSSSPVWEWKGDEKTGYTGASATFSCGNHGAHVRTARAMIRCVEDKDVMRYTAIAVFNGRTYYDTKTVSISDDEEDYKAPSKKPSKSETATETAQTKKTVTINKSTVTGAAIRKAIKKAGGNNKVTRLILGKKVKKIKKGALKGTKIKTVVVKSKKLKKKTVKGCLKGSKVTTIKLQLGSKKLNKKYIKKYKKIFTRKNAGKKVKVK